DMLAEVAAEQLGPAPAGRADQSEGEARLAGHRHHRRLAVARQAGKADLLAVHGRVGSAVAQRPARAPAPPPSPTPAAPPPPPAPPRAVARGSSGGATSHFSFGTALGTRP